MAFFLDANVPMYAGGADHPYKPPCVKIMRAIAQGRLHGVTSSEVLQEILHRFFSLRESARGVAMVRDVLTVMPDGILPVGRAEIDEAVSIAHLHDGAARDCVHWATMRINGLTDIISADQDFDGLPGITRHDPLALAAQLPA